MSSGTPRQIHKILLKFEVNGRILANWIGLYFWRGCSLLDDQQHSLFFSVLFAGIPCSSEKAWTCTPTSPYRWPTRWWASKWTSLTWTATRWESKAGRKLSQCASCHAGSRRSCSGVGGALFFPCACCHYTPRRRFAVGIICGNESKDACELDSRRSASVHCVCDALRRASSVFRERARHKCVCESAFQLCFVTVLSNRWFANGQQLLLISSLWK